MGHDRDSHSNRQNRVRSIFAVLGLKGIIFFDLRTIRYLTGFSGSDGVLLLGADRTILLVDGRYQEQAARQAGSAEIRLYEDKVTGILDALSANGGQSFGFDASALSVDLYLSMTQRLGEKRLSPLREEIRLVRAIKEDAEVDLMRRAAAISSESVISLFPLIRPGVSERELAAELGHLLQKNGSDGPSFPIIAASGENSALPHAAPGGRRIQEGDILIIDCGAIFDGYCSDETVTVVLGPLDPEKKQAYEVVREALQEGLDIIRPGVPCREVDGKARGRIERAGWGQFFSHGTGHGVGLDVHEAPRLSTRSEELLEEGMVITVEPGVYFPGKWGIRLEDMVVVRRNGIEILSRVPKELKVL
ncbi:MAG: aminopeptidase P family protein [Syntrophaceae bacterium]|nr:aminopeptidase P family protein [Syntrophaceae bacterium]